MSSKYKENDIIMGYQIAVNYTGLFVGKIIRVRPAIKLFGSPSYEIELLEGFREKGYGKIWVDEEFSVPYEKEKFDIALDHWKKFHEYIGRSKDEIRELRALFSAPESSGSGKT